MQSVAPKTKVGLDRGIPIQPYRQPLGEGGESGLMGIL